MYDGKYPAIGRALGGDPHLLFLVEGEPLAVYLVLVVQRAPDNLALVERQKPPAQLAIAEAAQNASAERREQHGSAVNQALAPSPHHCGAVLEDQHPLSRFLPSSYDSLEKVVAGLETLESSRGVARRRECGLVMALVVVLLLGPVVAAYLRVGRLSTFPSRLALFVMESFEHVVIFITPIAYKPGIVSQSQHSRHVSGLPSTASASNLPSCVDSRMKHYNCAYLAQLNVKFK